MKGEDGTDCQSITWLTQRHRRPHTVTLTFPLPLQSSNGRYLYIHLMFFNLNFKKGQRQWTVTTQIKLDKCKEKTVIIRAPKCNKTKQTNTKIVIIALQSQMFVVSS